MYDIVSVGGIVTDLILRLPKLPAAGTCVTATELYHGLGGKGANQAVAASRLGGRVALVGCVGDDDAGRSALSRLASEGVAVEHVARDRTTATGTVVLQRGADGEKQVVVFPGANARLDAEAIDAASPILAAARVVLVQLEIPLDAVQRVAAIVRASGGRLILDASPIRPLPREIVRAATAVKANASEAAALTGIPVHDLASARAAAAELMTMGVELVAIEAGADGNLFASKDEEVFLPLHDVPAVDLTGAGDTMAGALAVAMVEGRSLREAAAFASAAAALATRGLGAQSAMPSRAELERWPTGRAAH
ncbi:MAG TPA: ribokinase [Thermoanaerobaculia bacterium]|nr:ribokinase [Thermoanaerobaculia bacterium]